METKTYYLGKFQKNKNAKVTADININTGETTVLRGSICTPKWDAEDSESFKKYKYRSIFNDMLDKNIIRKIGCDYTFVQSYTFSDPTLANRVIQKLQEGRASHDFRDEDGNPYQ